MKDGLFTTEFWAALALTIGSLLFTLLGDVTWDQWADLMKWIWGAYMAARAITKGATAIANGKTNPE